MAIFRNSHEPDRLDIYFHMINHYKRIRSARSHFNFISDSKKTKEVSYPPTQRENIDTTHYPNHSVGVKKHDCIFKSEGDRNRCNMGCNAFRPVTRRNITDMPNNEICDNASKSVDKFTDKNCPNLKTKQFSGTPQHAYENLGQEYSDTPCIANGIRKCKPECYANRKIDRRKFAFQEHIARMQYAKQHCAANCEGTNRITYCDGCTETDPCPLMRPTPNKYHGECDLYKTLPLYAPLIATRSFGTCTRCKSPSCKKPSCSIGTNTANKEQSDPPHLLKQHSFCIPSPWRKQDYNTSARGGGCYPSTCPIQTVINMTKRTNSISTQNTSTQQVMASEVRGTPTQTVEENVRMNVAPSQAKENIQCSEVCPFSNRRQCTTEINCKMSPTGDKDVPVLGTDTNLGRINKLEEIRRKYMRQTKDEISQVSTTTSEEKATTSTDTVDYEPYSNILSDSHKAKQSNSKMINSMQAKDSNKFATCTSKQNNKKGRKRHVANIERQSDVSYNNKKSLDVPIDSVINENSPEKRNSDESSQSEISRERKSKKVKRKLCMKTNSAALEPEQLHELHNLSVQHPNLPSVLLEVLHQYSKESKRVSENPQENVLGEPEQDDERKLSRLNKTDEDLPSTKSTSYTQIVEAISAYLENISLDMKYAEDMAHISMTYGYQTADLNKIVRMLYNKIKDISSDSDEDNNIINIKSIPLVEQNRINTVSKSNSQLLKIARKLENVKDGEMSEMTRNRIIMKQSGNKTNKKVCAKRKGLKHVFKNLDDRICESLLKLSSEKTGNVEEHEYLQFCLRITEDIIRNDLYTNGQMRRVFKSHLEANRGRLDTQRMIRQINSLCLDLNIPFNETFPFENITSTSKCGKNIDKNYICYCHEENGTLEAKRFCMCNSEYYKNLMVQRERGTRENLATCQCGVDFCIEDKCPGAGYIELLTEVAPGERGHVAGPDFDFANEGVLQSVMYSETKCLGPRNKEGECNCVTLEMASNTIRPTSVGTTGYISSINQGGGAARRSLRQGMVNGEGRNSIGNKGKCMTSLRLRGMNRKDGALAAPNSYADTNEDSAPVRIKTPVTALRTQFGGAKTDTNFVVVECPVLVPTGDLIGMKNATELQNTAGSDVQFKLNHLPIEVKKQPEKSTDADVIAQLKEDMKQVVYANEINETLTDPLAVPACNNCSCNAECSDINGELVNNATLGTYEERAERSHANQEMVQTINRNQFSDRTIDDEVQNVPPRKKNNVSKAFATSGLKSRLEELTAVTLAISNNNMQSMLEKHPTYKQMESCTTCHFNKNFAKPVESANVFYPSRALNSVYSKCLFQQNNLLLGDEYVMFNPYSVRPETILHFFPTACTQVASADFMKDSKSSISSGISSVTGIVENIIRASKDSSTSGSVKQLALVPPENLVKAIKNEIYKAAEKIEHGSQELEEVFIASEKDLNSHTSSRSKSTKNSQESSRSKMGVVSVQGEKDSKLPFVKEEENEAFDDLISYHASIFDEEQGYEVAAYEESKTYYGEIPLAEHLDVLLQSEGTISETILEEGEHKPDLNYDTANIANIVSRVSAESVLISKEDSSQRSIIDINQSESSIIVLGANKWMKKLDNVPSIKMTPSLKGSFDKALSDTDKFRGVRNSNEDGPLMTAMMKHLRNDQLNEDVSNTSQHKKQSNDDDISKRGSDISKRGSDYSKRGSDYSKRGSDIIKRGSDYSKRGSDNSKHSNKP